jgi:methyltransferase
MKWLSASSASSAVEVILTVGAVVYVLMLLEGLLASRNERAQRARGGIEPAGDVYRMMQVAYPGAFLVMLAEGAVRGTPPAVQLAAGAALFAAAKALKWWAIASLGRFWTFRVIVVPGAALVRSGPYRVMRHPNYLAVVGELTGVALMVGARLAGPVVTLAFVWLITRRIAVEERALDAILRPR